MQGREGYHQMRGRRRPNQRQRALLDLLVEDRSNAEIAERLGITVSGVRWHISELLGETGLEDRQALARWWREERRRRMGWAAAFLGLRLAATGATVALAAAVLGLLALALTWQGRGSRDDGGLATLETPLPEVHATSPLSNEFGPAPTCDTLLPPDFRIVSADELRAEGLLEIGKVLEPRACPIRVSNRADRAAIWLADGGEIDLPRAGLHQVFRFRDYLGSSSFLQDLGFYYRGEQFLLTAMAVRGPGRDSPWSGDWSGLDVAVSDSREHVDIRRAGEQGITLVVSAQGEDSGRWRVAMSSQGDLFLGPEPLGGETAVEGWSGLAIDVTDMQELRQMELDLRSDFAFNRCDVETSLCDVVYRHFEGMTSGTLRSPIGGVLRCLPESQLTFDISYDPPRPVGEMEIDNGDFVLRFQETYASGGSPSSTWRCDERTVQEGEVISRHVHFVITAFTPEGKPLSVVISEDGTLYVGDAGLQRQ